MVYSNQLNNWTHWLWPPRHNNFFFQYEAFLQFLVNASPPPKKNNILYVAYRMLFVYSSSISMEIVILHIH